MPNPIISNNTKQSYMAHRKEINKAIQGVLDSGCYILGKEVSRFEQEFVSFLGVTNAIGTGSGTEALHLALKACGIGPGDIVITVSHTAVATIVAIELSGATPLLVDINPATYTMDPYCLKEAIQHMHKRKLKSKGKLKAIIPVHLYGYPADMPAIMDIARRNSLDVIEDCAQSHGASIHGQKTGTWGEISAFSFYPTKNLGAFGDGGALVTNNKKLAERARMLREYGWQKRYISEIAGMNSRLDELQAAILRVKLRYLRQENARRREIAKIYNTLLPKEYIVTPKVSVNVKHAYHQYVIRCLQRDNLQEFLKARKISTGIHYPVPVHLQPAYKGRLMISSGGLKFTEIACKEILSLPIYPQMKDEQCRRICGFITKWTRKISDRTGCYKW